jgi:hypothetical protein
VIVALERLGRLSVDARLVVEPLPPLDRLPDAVLETGGQSSLPAAGRSIITARERRSTGLAIGGSVLLLALFVSLWRMGGDGSAGVTGVARLAPRQDPGAPTLTATLVDASSEMTPLPLLPEPTPPGAAPAGPLAPPAPATTATSAALPTAALLGEGAPLAKGESPAAPAVVELLPGKSVEIEARTRLSLRVAKDNALYTSATPSAGGSRRGSTLRARDEAKAARGGSGSNASTGAAPSAPTAAGNGTGGGAATDAAKMNKELMNPWPSAPSAAEP